MPTQDNVIDWLGDLLGHLATFPHLADTLNNICPDDRAAQIYMVGSETTALITWCDTLADPQMTITDVPDEHSDYCHVKATGTFFGPGGPCELSVVALLAGEDIDTLAGHELMHPGADLPLHLLRQMATAAGDGEAR